MSPPLLGRRPRPEDIAEDFDEEVDLPPIADGVHQATSALAAKAATVGLTACLLLGPVGALAGGLALTRSSGPAPVRSAVVADQSNAQAVVGEFAQRVVVTWLTTTQDRPDELLALVKDAQSSSMPREAFVPSDPTVAGIVQAGGTWSVTIAVTVTDARKMTVRRFFQVPVRLGEDGAVTALTLPAPVAAPAVAPGSSHEYRTQLSTTSAAAQTVTEFLSAYLAGTGDVARYLTPGVRMTAITPAPYTAVRLDDLHSTGSADPEATAGDGQRLQVLAAATVAVTAQQTSGVAYALTLISRAGRWEITAIDPAPAAGPASAPADTNVSPASGSSDVSPARGNGNTPALSGNGQPAPPL